MYILRSNDNYYVFLWTVGKQHHLGTYDKRFFLEKKEIVILTHVFIFPSSCLSIFLHPFFQFYCLNQFVLSSTSSAHKMFQHIYNSSEIIVPHSDRVFPSLPYSTVCLNLCFVFVFARMPGLERVTAPL